jgi:hypothetical protein
VSGTQGGGSVRIGGAFHGAGADIRYAQISAVAPGATISADALGNGDGGSVAVWSDHTTRYYGAISARGGSAGGNGGSVEVSGKEVLEFRGAVDTRAPHGSNGTLLLDPADIVISASAPLPSDTELNVNQPTAGDAIGLIKFGDGAATFTISTESLETVATANNIDLQAKNSITINDLDSHVNVPNTLSLGTAPGGFARFRTGAGGFSMAPGNTISVVNGSLTIDAMDPGATGTGAVSVGTLSAKGGITLKGTAVTLNGALAVTTAGAGVSITGPTTLGAGGGTITLAGSNAANDVTLGSVNGAHARAITATGGDIVLGAVGPTVTGVTLTGNTASLAAVATSGAQDYSGVTTTTLNGTLAISTAGFGISAGAVNLAAGGGTITLTGSYAAYD